jgi:hypothetical protein
LSGGIKQPQRVRLVTDPRNIGLAAV